MLDDQKNLMCIDDWFSVIAAGCALSTGALQDLREVGFVVIHGPVVPDALAHLVSAYDSAVACANADDLSEGSTTTRVHDFVNRGPEFDGIYVYQPILEACCRIIGQPFKLSTLLARTLRPGSRAQGLHVDFKRDAEGWPMIGFIFMVDEFRRDNGATRFLPGCHRWCRSPEDVMNGHATNQSGEPRRSLQGAYIPRDAEAAINQAERIRPETLARIGLLAKYLLAI